MKKEFYEKAFEVQEYMRSKNVTPFGLMNIAEIIKTIDDMDKETKMSKERQTDAGGKINCAKKKDGKLEYL